MHRTLIDLERVNWPEVLPRLGIDQLYFERPGRSKPCPLHPVKGSTKFRFLKPYDRCLSVCNDCGVLTPVALVMAKNGWDWERLFDALRGSGVPPSPRQVQAPGPDELARRAAEVRRQFEKMRRWWRAAKSVGMGDSSARRYLERRIPRIAAAELGSDLRAHPGMSYYDDAGPEPKWTQWPALLALFRDADGEVHHIHRIYVKPDGTSKAPVESPRKMFVPGEWVPGCAVRVGHAADSRPRVIGVAEGVEKACAIFTACAEKFPVWAAGSADNLAVLQIPDYVEVVHIFADHNLATAGHPRGHGQEAAEALANRLRAQGRKVSVRVARTPGGDHEDDWLAMASSEASA